MSSTISHEAAIESRAAARYVLGEMNEEDARAFEDHFFDCQLCAGEVNETASFADNAEVALREDRAGAIHPRFRAFRALRLQVALPLAASLVLGCVAVYQGAFVIPQLELALQPRTTTFSMLRAVRSAPSTIEVARSEPTFALVLDLPFERVFPRYTLVFRSAAGEVAARLEASGPGPLLLTLPVSGFPDGDYTMTLTGRDDSTEGPGAAVETYHFEVVTRKEAGADRTQ